jgi:hypothetical protein
MSQTPTPDDDPRDAHLLAALRHAPDRDLAPPPQLSAAILEHAQHALQIRRARVPRWQAAWACLWQPAPMAAFGTVAMATLIGVLWSGHEIPDATPSLRSAPAATPAPTAPGKAAELSAPSTVAQDQAPAAAPLEAPAPAQRVARPLPTPKPSPLPNAVEPPVPAPSPASPAPPPARARERQAAAQESEARRAAAAMAPTQAPVATAAPGVATTPTTPAGPMPRDALAKALADAAPAPAAARARSEMAAGALGAAAPAAALQPVSPLLKVDAEIEAALAGDPARVRWRVAGQQLVAHQAAQRDWWADVLRATQGRWQAVASGAAGAEAAPLLLIDAAPRGSFAFEPQALVWREAGGATWRAPIDAETLRRWQETLARW